MLFFAGFWLSTLGIALLMSPYDSKTSRSYVLAVALRAAVLAEGAQLLAMHFNLA